MPRRPNRRPPDPYDPFDRLMAMAQRCADEARRRPAHPPALRDARR